MYKPDRPENKLYEAVLFSSHDVTGEKRDDKGKWTESTDGTTKLAPWQENEKKHNETMASKYEEMLEFMNEVLSRKGLSPEQRVSAEKEKTETEQEIQKYRGVAYDPHDADYVYHSSSSEPQITRQGIKSAPYYDSATGEERSAHIVWITEGDQGVQKSGQGGYGSVFRVSRVALKKLGLELAQSSEGEDIIQRKDGKPFRITPDLLERYDTPKRKWVPIKGKQPK